MNEPKHHSAEQEFPAPQPIVTSPKLTPKKRHWFAKHRKLTIILAVLLALVIAGGIVAAVLLNQKGEPAPQNNNKPVVEVPEQKYYSLLTGAQVENQAATTAPVTGVMVENSPDARPQSGLKNSGVVFEAIAEGGITRFMVLYQAEKPQIIGPVRSVRLYDVDWLKPFNGGLAHVGGSAQALNEIRNGSYRDLDQFFNSGYYWRASDRYAPHNVYTSFENLDELNQAKGYTSSEFTGFLRKDSIGSAEPNASSVSVTISSALYNSTYAYNKESNSYDRSQAGAPHLDREDGQISPRVLVVMKVNQSTELQDGYREVIQTTGSGSATIFQDGSASEVTWNKPTTSDQITFTNADGTDFALARGQTWIIAVPSDTGSVVWQ